jgi:hypothetical protein
MRAEFHAFASHQASQPPNFIQPDISWHRVGVNAGGKNGKDVMKSRLYREFGMPRPAICMTRKKARVETFDIP